LHIGKNFIVNNFTTCKGGGLVEFVSIQADWQLKAARLY
jgi:hypothetical protein